LAPLFLPTKNISKSTKKMLRKSKICIVTNRSPVNQDDTASPFVSDFYLGLKKRGVETFIFTPAYDVGAVEVDANIFRFKWAGGRKVIGSLSFSNPKELYQIYSFLACGRKELKRFVKENRIEQILALWALPSGWFAYSIKKKFGIPYSVWCLGSDIYVWARKPFLKSLTKKVLTNADYLFADGFDLKEKVEKLIEKPCHFLPSMRVLPNSNLPEVQIDKSKTNFVYVGRWEKEKGIDDLVNAFKLVNKDNPETHLYIIGWGEYESQMRELVRKLNLAEDVTLLGKVPTAILTSYLKECSCTVIPSEGDSIPLVFSESLQMRTPLIVTEVGDMGFLTRKFELGKVVPPDDSQKLALAMIEFTKEKGKDYSPKIREALELLSIDKAVDDYLKIVDKDIGFP
jgi:glycosyltransferase involved in cell wall biosynthesis